MNGSIDPGDGYVLNLLAEAGLDSRPERAEVCCKHCGDRDEAKHEPGPGCPECLDTGMGRETGRGFVGPDADEAEAILETVRGDSVAQAAGRFARNPDDPDDTAIVFIRTDAAPDSFIDYNVPGVTWGATAMQQEIIETLKEHGEATTTELADAVGCTNQHVRDTLDWLREDDTVVRQEGGGAYGATVWKDAGASPHGIAELDTANDDVQESYTWSFGIEATEPDGYGKLDTSGEVDAHNGGDRLGEDVDAGGHTPGKQVSLEIATPD